MGYLHFDEIFEDVCRLVAVEAVGWSIQLLPIDHTNTHSDMHNDSLTIQYMLTHD